jgi:DNA-binding NarL/FixJ family response regulator
MKIKEKIYRVVVVDDHALFRAGLVSLLRQMECFEVVGEAQNGVEAVDVVRDTIPDLVILDVNMPVMNGVGTVRVLRKMQVLARIVMLTISKNEADLMRAIQEGADGYLLKNAEPDQLKQALLQVMGDKSVISPDMVKTVFNAVRAIGADAGDLLTEREKDVLTCLVQGMTTKEIGDNLVISKNTVKTHVRNIMKKLDASNRAEIVGIALKKGLI